MSSAYFILQKLLGIEPAPSSADTLRVYGVRRPNDLAEVSLTVITISFTRNADAVDTMADSGSALVTAGFKAGDFLKVTGGSNDGLIARIGSLVAGTISFHRNDRVATESAGTSITVTTVTAFDEEYEDAIVSWAAYRLARQHGLSRTLQADLKIEHNEDLSQIIADVFQTEDVKRMRYREI